MKDELELKLAEEFPFMRLWKNVDEQRKDDSHISQLYDAFYCDVDDGWYELIRGLCRDITTAYEKAGLPVDIVIDQVKEKFGTLRFYYHLGVHSPVINALDLIEDGSSIGAMPRVSDLQEEIEQIVEKWEEESGNVCEKCGSAGELRDDLSWIQTLCDSCYAQIKKSSDNRE